MSGFESVTTEVWGAGGLTAVLAAIAVPAWRAWLARNNTGINRDRGESDWMAQQAKELAQSKQLIAELMKLRATDAELIAALKLDKAMSQERTERMQRRMDAMEHALIRLDPEFAQWLRIDYGDAHDVKSISGKQS